MVIINITYILKLSIVLGKFLWLIISPRVLLLFRRGYVTVSPQEFPAPMIFASCGDLLFRQKKKAKLIQEVSWKSLALVRFYLWDTGELTFFTLFAVCTFKGTRAVRSDTSLRHCLFFRLTYFLFRWYFFVKPQFTSRLWRLSRVPPGPMNLFVQISASVFKWSKLQFRWNPRPLTS